MQRVSARVFINKSLAAPCLVMHRQSMHTSSAFTICSSWRKHLSLMHHHLPAHHMCTPGALSTFRLTCGGRWGMCPGAETPRVMELFSAHRQAHTCTAVPVQPLVSMSCCSLAATRVATCRANSQPMLMTKEPHELWYKSHVLWWS
jgi:hypothetical protein